MATIELVTNYSMYVIGTVESNCNWAAVYRSDPITIGLTQNYGQRAATLIAKCRETDPDGWAAFQSAAPALSAAVDAGHSWEWWTGYYINDAEAAAWEAWAARAENHLGQSQQWTIDASGYVNRLQGYGCSLDYPQVLIYAMCMYHQSPDRAGRVLASCGGSATLDKMHSTCLNDVVLGRYKNRYNTAYNMLKAWDGASEPPDFGQVIEGGGGGQAPAITQPNSAISRIQISGDILTAYGEGIYAEGVTFYKSAPNVWLPSISKAGAQETGGNTGGGSATGDPAITEMTAWLRNHIDAFAYSQGAGRLSPETSGYTDCSALLWYVYHLVTGQDIGTWMGAQVGRGSEVARGSGNLPQDKMREGDLILFNWRDYNPSYDHVEYYLGNNQLIGHGGPDNGPDINTDANAYANRAHDWMVRRYL